MIWSRLKDYKCPNCRRGLRKEVSIVHQKEGHSCACGFFISLEAFDKLISKLYTRRLPVKDDEVFSYINNMGNEEVNIYKGKFYRHGQ